MCQSLCPRHQAGGKEAQRRPQVWIWRCSCLTQLGHPRWARARVQQETGPQDQGHQRVWECPTNHEPLCLLQSVGKWCEGGLEARPCCSQATSPALVPFLHFEETAALVMVPTNYKASILKSSSSLQGKCSKNRPDAICHVFRFFRHTWPLSSSPGFLSSAVCRARLAAALSAAPMQQGNLVRDCLTQSRRLAHSSLASSSLPLCIN